MVSCSGGRAFTALIHTMPPFISHSRFSWRREADVAANRRLDDGVGEVGRLLSPALSLEKLTRRCAIQRQKNRQFGFLADIGKERENGPSVRMTKETPQASGVTLCGG